MWVLLAGCIDPPDLPLLGEVPIVAAPSDTCRDDEDVTVGAVVSGDRFELDSGEPVRMVGVAAPEPGDCFGDEAWDWLADAITGEELTLTFDRTCTDGDGLTLAWVWIRGEGLDRLPDLAPWTSGWVLDPEEPAVLLNEVILGEGFALPRAEEISLALVFQDRLDRAAAAAEQFSRGLRGACNGDD